MLRRKSEAIERWPANGGERCRRFYCAAKCLGPIIAGEIFNWPQAKLWCMEAVGKKVGSGLETRPLRCGARWLPTKGSSKCGEVRMKLKLRRRKWIIENWMAGLDVAVTLTRAPALLLQ